jgi:hypothetical protein
MKLIVVRWLFLILQCICKYVQDMMNTWVQAFGGLASDRFLGKLKNMAFSYSEYNLKMIVHMPWN